MLFVTNRRDRGLAPLAGRARHRLRPGDNEPGASLYFCQRHGAGAVSSS